MKMKKKSKKEKTQLSSKIKHPQIKVEKGCSRKFRDGSKNVQVDRRGGGAGDVMLRCTWKTPTLKNQQKILLRCSSKKEGDDIRAEDAQFIDSGDK